MEWIKFRLRRLLCFNYKRTFSEEFEDKMKDHPSYDEAYAFICWKDGVLPLYKEQQNYIVSGNGTTYSNLTYK